MRINFKFPLYISTGRVDCGPTCLRMVSKYYGKSYSLDFLMKKCDPSKLGTTLINLKNAAIGIGFDADGVKLSLDNLKLFISKAPIIIHWGEHHYVVAIGVNKTGIKIADPARGIQRINFEEFNKKWIKERNNNYGYALILEPTPSFYQNVNLEVKSEFNITKLFSYFFKYKAEFIQISLGMLLGSLLSLAGPFLSQIIIDKGINNKNINFIYLILIGQTMVFIGSSIIEAIRTWIVLHIGSRINFSMLSDFFAKILKLPISFFDIHHIGELMQRIDSHKRLESLVTTTSITTIFSIVNMFFLAFIIYFYNSTIFYVNIIGSLLSFLWLLLLLPKRKTLDAQYFELNGKQNNSIIELLTGVYDIKVSNSSDKKRLEWEELQGQQFKMRIKSQKYSQLLSIGSSSINRLTSIFITLISAQAVIEGEMTIGEMFAINMLIGQLNNPINQIRGIITTIQDAKLSWERISLVMGEEEEDPPGKFHIKDFSLDHDITITDIDFKYPGSDESVLKKINLVIPNGKITAIVGTSGSGKSTLLKLLLKFYKYEFGTIKLGELEFNNLHHESWRENCGVVIHEAKIFSGTIEENIALGKEINKEWLLEAAKIACIDDFILSLEDGYLTDLGSEGIQLSSGQKQRIILARAIYKKPKYLFLDEATNSLDTKTERQVIDNLKALYNNKTVIIIAHRLSTVMNADQIVVIDKGGIVEVGNHNDLVKNNGMYYQLVKNQIEINE